MESRSTLSDILRALSGKPKADVKVQLWNEVYKHKDQIQMSGSFLNQTLQCVNRSLADSESLGVQFATISCVSNLLECITDTRTKKQMINQVSMKTYELMKTTTALIDTRISDNTIITEPNLQTLFACCKTGIKYYEHCIQNKQNTKISFLLKDFHQFHHDVLSIIFLIFSRGTEWSVHLNSRKYESATAESLRTEQSSLFTNTTNLLRKFISLVNETKLDLVSSDFEAECNEMLFICNKLLPICEISATWEGLMDVSWQGVKSITSNYSNALEGKLDVDRIIKSLSFIIEHKFKECTTLAPRYKISSDLTKQILPTSNQKAFLGSVKFVRFALVVLVTVCKNYGKYISTPEILANLALQIRSQFPPAPASHSLAQSAVEAFTAIIPALDTLFRVLLASSRNDETRWQIFLPFEIPAPEKVNFQQSYELRALEKLQYLNAMISYTKFSGSLYTKVVSQVLPWITNGFQLITSDILYSSNQLSKSSKAPLYTKTLMAIAVFIIRSADNSWNCLPWLLEFIFHPHFLCNQLALDLWCFLIRNTNEFSFVLQITKEMMALLQKKKGTTDGYDTFHVFATKFAERTLQEIPETHRSRFYRDVLPSPIQMSSLDEILFIVSVLPFKYAGTTLQNTISTKIIKLCIQRCQEKVTPTYVNPQSIPLLRDITNACYSLLREEQIVSCLKDHRLRLVELLLQLLPFPHVHFSDLASNLFLLAIPLRHDFDMEQLVTFVDLVVQIVNVNGRTKMAAIEFMKSTKDIEIPQSHKAHGQIFEKLRDLNDLLLSDSNWPVRHSVLAAIECYSKFSLFDFKSIVPRKHLQQVLKFLKREFSPVSTEFEYTHLKNQQMIFSQVLVGRKRGLPMSQECATQKRFKGSAEEQIKEGLDLIRQALQSINPSALREHKSLLAREFQNFQNV